MVQITSERIEPFGPKALISRDPHRRLLHGRGFEFTAHHASLLGTRNQPGGLEHGKVLHEAGQRHTVWLRQLRDRGATAAQLRKQFAPRRIRQRRKHKIELGVFIVNH